MPKQYPLIAAFNGGEVSPLMEGRSDLGDKYNKFLKKCENYLVTPQGPAIFRPGFKYIASTKNGATEKSRLIPFRFSDTQAYVLEFGNLYIRVYRDDGQIEAPDSNVKLLIHANEADGTAGTSIVDSSPTGHTLTAQGNAQTDEAAKKLGNAALLFDGTQDWIEMPDVDASFDLTGNDWSLALWARPTPGNSAIYMIFGQDMDADTDDYMKLYLTWYTGLLLNGYDSNGDATNYSTDIADESMNTKTLTRDGKTSLLLHGIDSGFAETDDSQDILDSSPTGHTITPAGDAVISTNQSKFGGSSIHLPTRSTDYLTITGSGSHADFDFSGGSWTFETDIYLEERGGTRYVFGVYDGAGNYAYLIIGGTGNIIFRVYNSGGGGTPVVNLGSGASNPVSTGQWQHIVVVESGNNWAIFVDETRVASLSDASRLESSYADDWTIGYVATVGTNGIQAYFDNLRFVKTAMYDPTSSTITRPTRRHGSGEITTEDSKFGGSAISFTGADYLTHAGSEDTNFGGGSGSADVFTISAFIKPDAVSGTQYIFDMYVDATEWLRLYLSGTTLTAEHRQGSSTKTSSLGTVDTDWQHIAFVGDGTNINVFLDDVEGGSIAINGALSDLSAVAFFIGTDKDGANPFSGLIDDLKLMKNERYDVGTATLTVPAAEDRYICHAKFEIDDSTTNETLEGPDDNITPDSFHHIEVGEDFSDTDRFLLTDGVLDAVDTSFSVNTDNLDGKIYIGIDPDEASSDFKGWIDELVLYNGAVLHDAGANSVGDQVFNPPSSEYGTTGSGTPEEVTTTYTEDELFDIKYAQSADVLYLAHPNHAPAKLIRFADDDWRIFDIDFIPPPVVPNSSKPSATLTLDLKTVGINTGGVRTFTASAAVFKSGDVGKEIRELTGIGNGRAFIAVVTDTTHVECDIFVAFNHGLAGDTLTSGQWELVGSPTITALTLSTATPTVGQMITLTPDVEEVFSSAEIDMYIEVENTIDADGNTGTLLCKILSVDASSPKVATVICMHSQAFTDTSIADGEWSFYKASWDSTQGYPRTVTFYENRLLWAGTNSFPQTIFGSRVDDYENHLIGSDDSAAYQYTLAGREVNTIVWMEDSESLLIGTIGAEWTLGSRNILQPVTPTNVDARVQTSKGSANIQPLKLGQRVIYVQKGATRLNELIFDFNVDKFVSDDLMLFAEHIALEGIVEIDYQDEPYGTIWAVRDDGTLLALTFLKDEDVIAWHRHTTGLSGEFESVAVIPGNTHDDVWVIVKRTVNGATARFIERLTDVFTSTDIDDGVFMDSCKIYSGALRSTIDGLDHLEGEEVDIVGDGLLQTVKTVSSGAVTLDTAATNIVAGKKYTGLLQIVRLEGGSVSGTAQGRVKKITKLGIRFYNTYNALFGPSETENDRISFTAGELFSGDKVDLDYPEGYETDGNITIKQDRPFPQTIVAIMPDVDTKGF